MSHYPSPLFPPRRQSETGNEINASQSVVETEWLLIEATAFRCLWRPSSCLFHHSDAVSALSGGSHAAHSWRQRLHLWMQSEGTETALMHSA